MRLTITILSGTRAGQRYAVAPGDTLRIGRTSKADVAVADDPTMSAVHYELRCSDDQATVLDLQSRNGLFVNGQPVGEAVLSDGDQLRAGRTFFGVALEGITEEAISHDPNDETRAPGATDATHAPGSARPIREVAGSPPPLGTMVFAGRMCDDSSNESGTLDGSTIGPRIIAQHREAIERLYAVVDGSTAQALIQQAKRSNLRTENLVAAGSSPYLNAVSPYLVDVSDDDDFAVLWQQMLAQGPGILIESRSDFNEVLVHIRSIFCRRDEDGRTSFFRFYEPGLLYAWLQECTPPQLTSFFGCFSSVVLAIDAGTRLLRLTHDKGALAEEALSAG
ncbi:MAG TPA: DUF4123 domain-containing protein [Pirellulales bacterium]|nr:DUF4123 domain-containing protein [Pirellulales bacterium]